MKTLTTQHSSPARTMSWKLLPALLAALFSFCAFPSNAQTYTVGTGTSMYSQTGVPAPIGYYYPSGRMQYLYDTASLRAAGMPIGGGSVTIHQIAFNVGALQSSTPAPNISIGIDNYTMTNTLPTGVVNGIPVRYAGAPIVPALGWNNINLTTSFVWDGVSPIIVDMCYSTGTSLYGIGNAGVYYTSISGKSNYGTASTGTVLCSPTPISVTALSYRPNIRFTKLAPCLGAPTAGTLTPSGTVSTLCPGTVATITSSGYSNALGTSFQWMSSPTGTAGSWVAISGATNPNYVTPPMISTTYYHLVITCANSGLKDSTANTVFSFTAGYPVYGSIPYFEGFENWSNGCATNDKISSNNWTNFPITGDASWRREDQYSSASWTYTTSYPPPTAKEGLHCAGHNSYVPTANNEGSLNLYVNASATTGSKDLSFWWRMNYTATTNYDSLNVEMSIDGGLNFTSVGKLGNASGIPATWNYARYPINTTSATTVIRFRAKALTTYHQSVFIDAVQIDPPCAGAPVAGTISPVLPCTGKPFTLSTTGGTVAAGLTYLWQYRVPGTTSWFALPGGTVASPTATMIAATDYRVIVTCTNSTPPLSDTSKVLNATLAPFYYCYCGVSVSPSYINSTYILVGNVTIKTQPAGVPILNNGNPLPTIGNTTTNTSGYEDFRLTVPAPTLIRDSTYSISVTQTAALSSWQPYGYGCAWLDINRNGVFDDPSERIIYKPITVQSNPTVTALFTIPSNAPTGITGLRVMDSYYNSTTGVLPCGVQYAYAQAEDYLVRIEYQPCNGPVTPGTAWASDTAICPGYSVDMFDTSYEKTRTNILRTWEVSTNGGASFSAIPGSAQKDSLLNVTVTASSRYRLRVICGPTGDTTYSNVLIVTAPSPVRCYPTAWAGPGGASDSSDIGAFIIGNFVNPPASFPAGPHLLNPLAHQRRTDYTLLPPIQLDADSTYRLAIFHTMPRGIHADAMVSVYIDYNNDLKYDQFVAAPPYTSELVFQGITRIDSFFLDTKITIPDAVIPNVPTGMRVVLNNNVSSPTAAGNSGSGVFTSGEVEDYIVILRRAGLSAGSATLLQNLALYPNPTEGKFTILSDAARSVAHLNVVVSTITGQQVFNRSFDNVGTHFTTSLDLSTQAKGIYFVEIRADGEKITKKLVIR